MNTQRAGAEAMNLSERIRLARGRAGLTQQAFADEVGVGSKTVGNWENGRSSPRAVELAAIERVLAARGLTLHPVPQPATSGVELAVLDDPKLSARGKALLLDLYRQLSGVEQSEPG